LAELEGLHEHVVIIDDKCAIEAEQLSWFVRGISDALVDLNMLPI
jgi:hypothetical protein